MKKLFTSFLIILSCSFCKAQWVTIPDANFRNWLNTHGYSSCMNGTLMDTTCSAVVNATSIGCALQNIYDLTGIQYFDNLSILGCELNHLTSLPHLPNSLTKLYCSNNILTALPALPNSLNRIECYANYLTSLPSLPNSLTYFSCTKNQLTSLPTLPALLTELRCEENQITSLPVLPANLNRLFCRHNFLSSLPTLPNSIQTLYCAYNPLTSLPALPTSIISLYCVNNQLTSLPTLPSSIFEITCTSNQLTSLPELTGSSLSAILCDSNQITVLPELPYNLHTLYCGANPILNLPILPTYLNTLSCVGNLLTALPELPSSLRNLYCSDNFLLNLPLLPDSMYAFIVNNNPQLTCMPVLNKFGGMYDFYFNISNTGITCLPSTIQHSGYMPSIDTMPICTCTFPSGITTSNITTTSAKINWSTECCSQFQIQVRVTGTATWSIVTALSTATSRIISPLSSGTTYDLRMRVKCIDGTTYSSWSPIQTFTTLVSCVAPTGLTVSNLTQTHATINWNAVANAYAYKFQGRKLGTTTWSNFTIYAPITFKTLNGLTANTTYQYKLQTVCNASGIPTSPWTAIGTFSTPLRMEDESFENIKTDFSIYPNPVSDQLTVICNQLAINEIEIKDLLGRVLITQQVSEESSNTIDVSYLSSALYFISIRRNDGSVFIKQFVKE